MAKTSIKQTSSARTDTMSIIPSSNTSMGAYDPVYPLGVSVLTFLQPYNLTETFFSMPWGQGVAKRIYI